ncbi:MAG: nitrite reductase (NAD(P)H) small subunit [Gemmatimonadota bacterium]
MTKDANAGYETVLRTPDLGPGHVAEVMVNGETLALVNVSQTYYALDAFCPVDGTNLARSGQLDGERLVCPGDHTAYDLATGKDAQNGKRLRRWPLRVEGNEIRVAPPGPA